MKRTTKAGKDLAQALTPLWRGGHLPYNVRLDVLHATVTWFYRQGHDVPGTPEAIEAFALKFETALGDADCARAACPKLFFHKAPRARRWRTVYKTLLRHLPFPPRYGEVITVLSPDGKRVEVLPGRVITFESDGKGSWREVSIPEGAVTVRPAIPGDTFALPKADAPGEQITIRALRALRNFQ